MLSGEPAHPAVFELLDPPFLAKLCPCRPDARGRTLHRRVHVKQRSVGVEDDGLYYRHGLALPVIGRLARDRHVVHMAFAETGPGHAPEASTDLKLGD